MQNLTQTIGQDAENQARDFLLRHSLKFIEANYNCKYGEIDLIMRDGESFVFVEVRYRKNHDYGDGAATVTKSKQQKIIKTATHYLQKNSLLDKVACRFDVVSASDKTDIQIQWIKDAFWAKW